MPVLTGDLRVGQTKTEKKMRARTKIGIFAFGCGLAIVIGYLLVALEVFPSNQFESTLRKAIAGKRGEPLNIQEVTPFKWDRLDVYTPYTTFKDENGRTIDVDEGHCYLVFSKNGATVSTLKFKRYYGDFAGLHREGGYSPSSARFIVTDPSKGSWLKLEWIGTESPTRPVER